MASRKQHHYISAQQAAEIVSSLDQARERLRLTLNTEPRNISSRLAGAIAQMLECAAWINHQEPFLGYHQSLWERNEQ